MWRPISKALRKNILVGLALVTPLGITILIANWLFVLVTNVFLTKGLETSGQQLLFRALALLTVLCICFLIGFFTRTFFGRQIYRLGDRILTRVPIINRIYLQVRHMSEVIVARRQTLFQDVVMLEYPRRGIYSLGFVTAAVPPTMQTTMATGENKDEFVSLFIPTTPNPTSGLMIMAPRSELTKLKLDVAEAMKFIVSAGAVHPGDGPPEGRADLLDKLEAWSAHDTREPSAAKEDASDA